MLSKELTEAAEALGQALRETELVQMFLEAHAQVRADPEASALEDRLWDMYENLLARQHAGERISRTEIDEFNVLRMQVQKQSLIADRDMALTVLKGYLAEVAQDLSNALGLDYIALALAE